MSRANKPPLPGPRYTRAERRKTKYYALHRQSPAGMKIRVRFFKNARGAKPENLAELLRFETSK